MGREVDQPGRLLGSRGGRKRRFAEVAIPERAGARRALPWTHGPSGHRGKSDDRCPPTPLIRHLLAIVLPTVEAPVGSEKPIAVQEPLTAGP